MYRRFPPESHRRREQRFERREDALIVLDYLELGNPTDIHPEHRNQPFLQGLGEKYFTLLEATPLPAIRVDIFEIIDLTPPSKVKRIIPVSYSELTSVARANLPEAVKIILTQKEKLFVEFFNIAEPINIRIHALELLPEIGKKTMQQILDARRKEPFKSFQDIRERVRVDPVKALVGRIVKEIEGGEKYYLFVRHREGEGLYLGYLERMYASGGLP